MAGCVAQAEGAEILRRQPAVDVVVGPQSYHRLPELLREAQVRSGVIDTDFPAEDKFSRLPPSPREAVARRGVAAFVTVQEGCDKFCSFCVVPYTRGAEVSRPVGAILRGNRTAGRRGRARGHADRTERQRLSWARRRRSTGQARRPDPRSGRGSGNPAGALRDLPPERHERRPDCRPPRCRGSGALSPSSGPVRFRSHSGVDEPAPHASPTTSTSCRARATARPDIAFSSDFIVGYPGESEADFRATLDLARKVGFASSYAFKYSPRPGTPAAEMDGQVDEAVKAARLAELQALLEEQRQAFNRRLDRAALRGPVREAAAGARGRSSAVRRICRRCSPQGPPSLDRRHGRGRNRRRRAEFVAGPNCLASVVKGGFDRRAGRFGAGTGTKGESRFEAAGFVAVAHRRRLRNAQFDASRIQTGRNRHRLSATTRPLPSCLAITIRISPASSGAWASRLTPMAIRSSSRVRARRASRRAGCSRCSTSASSWASRRAKATSRARSPKAPTRGSSSRAKTGRRRASASSRPASAGVVRARNAAQDRYLAALRKHELVFAEGPAGTGKTWLAVGHAVSLLEQGLVERLVLSRPAVEAGERLGFLPGDMRDKVDPYLRPIYDALYDFMDGRMVERGIQTGMIEIAPLAFMRGRTLSKAAVLLDEAQNATAMQMKMFLTRLGEGSRMMVNGDPTQTDLAPGQKSGLGEAIKLLVGDPADRPCPLHAMPTSCATISCGRSSKPTSAPGTKAIRPRPNEADARDQRSVGAVARLAAGQNDRARNRRRLRR